MLAHSFVVVLLALANVPADTIVTGHAAVRDATIRTGTDTTEIFGTRDGKRQRVATGIQSVTRTAGGYLVVHTSQGRGGLSIDSVTIATSTLAPLRHTEAFLGRTTNLTYAGGRVTGTATDSGVTKAIDIPVPAGRFDFSTLQQVTASLPLATGYEAVVLTYDVATKKERAIGFSVAGREAISWGGAEVDAFKTVTDFTTHKVTRWIDAKTRRDLRWEIVMPGMTMEGIVR